MTPILAVKILLILCPISFIFGFLSERKRIKDKEDKINKKPNQKEPKVNIEDIKIICK